VIEEKIEKVYYILCVCKIRDIYSDNEMRITNAILELMVKMRLFGEISGVVIVDIFKVSFGEEAVKSLYRMF